MKSYDTCKWWNNLQQVTLFSATERTEKYTWKIIFFIRRDNYIFYTSFYTTSLFWHFNDRVEQGRSECHVTLSYHMFSWRYPYTSTNPLFFIIIILLVFPVLSNKFYYFNTSRFKLSLSWVGLLPVITTEQTFSDATVLKNQFSNSIAISCYSHYF